MKSAGTPLINFLANNTNMLMADLYTITCRNGQVLRYTGADINITTSDARLFVCRDVLLTGAKMQDTRGLNVNNSDVTAIPSPTSNINGIPFIQAAVNGVLDRATIKRERVFMPTWGDTSLGTVTIFLGEITDVEPTRTNVVLKCKDLTNLLNIQMPLRQFQPNCSWTFGDSNCTINRSALAMTYSVTAGSTAQIINCNATTGAGFYNQGVIKFTSGLNAGLSKTVKSWVPGQATLVSNMAAIPSIGDTFTLTPGCDKTKTTCQNTYSNLIHFGGEPDVPVPETAH